MKYIFSTILAVLIASYTFGQIVEKNDPAATQILNKISKAYASNNSIEMDFDLVINFPGMEEQVQNGRLIQKGDQYFLDMDMQSVCSDGKLLWMYMKNSNEVMLNNAADASEGGFMDPATLVNQYKSGDYRYGITGEKDGIQSIEFKPVDKSSPYSKMRMLVSKAKSEVKSIKIFSKDGSNYNMKIKNLAYNKEYPPSTFKFDANAHPNVHVEDLRID